MKQMLILASTNEHLRHKSGIELIDVCFVVFGLASSACDLFSDLWHHSYRSTSTARNSAMQPTKKKNNNSLMSYQRHKPYNVNDICGPTSGEGAVIVGVAKKNDQICVCGLVLMSLNEPRL